MPSETTDNPVRAAREAVEATHPGPWASPILLAVSGGADSMALLHLLQRGGLPVAVAHFDHQTRDGASAAEGDFVAETATGLGIPIHQGGADIAALASKSGESFEMAARRARYAFLAEIAIAHRYSAIATGHHADDQAETVLLRLLRGTGPTGLAGIPPMRQVEGVPLIRPLLGIRRTALESWLRGEGLAWRDDASNGDTDILRNRVRHELLPRLTRDFNPRAVEALCRLAHIQRREENFLARLTAEARARCDDGTGRLDRKTFVELDEALQFRVMAGAIIDAGGDGRYETACRAVAFMAEGGAGKQIDLGNGAVLFGGDSHVVLAAGTALAIEVALPVPGNVDVAGRRFQCRQESRAPGMDPKAACTPRHQIFDADRLDGPLSVRTRRPGDRFQPLGMAGTKKLKDYFNDLGLSRAERDRQLLLTCGDAIVWVVGHNASGSAAVTDATTRLVVVDVADCPEDPTTESETRHESAP